MEEQTQYNQDDPKAVCEEFKQLLRKIKSAFFFSGQFEKKLDTAITQLNTLFSAVTISEPHHAVPQLESLTSLLEEVAALGLQGTYKDRTEDMLETCLKRVMELSSPHEGLKLELPLLGKCLAVINKYSEPAKIRRFLETKSSHNFPMFYYMQHAVRGGFKSHPRHYPNISRVLDPPKLLSTLQGSLELPSTDVVIDELRNRCVSFNIQEMLVKCVSPVKGFQKRTAEFLIDACGADVDKRGGVFTFFGKAIYVINPKDPESLAELDFYLKNTKKTKREVLELAKALADEAYGDSNQLKNMIAVEFLEDSLKTKSKEEQNDNNISVENTVFPRSYSEVSAAVLAKFREQMHASLASLAAESSEKKISKLIDRYYLRHDNLFEYEKWIEAAKLDDTETQLLREQAKEMDPKSGRKLERYIVHNTPC